MSIPMLVKFLPRNPLSYCIINNQKLHSLTSQNDIDKDKASLEINQLLLKKDIHQELCSFDQTLNEISKYYFDGKGKSVRPLLTMSMAKACNSHLGVSNPRTDELQRKIAMISEMFHTSSLYHDDVIDNADKRRGKPSVNSNWTPSQAVNSGVYILSVSMRMLAQIDNSDVLETMTQSLNDLVCGEFQQMAVKSEADARFNLYLAKCYNKTATIMANSCKSAAILANDSALSKDIYLQDVAYNFGKNIGMAFQLVDDLLDFIVSSESLGKPSGADLKLGLATAPVLFASEQHPELEKLIRRKFSKEGDVSSAVSAVMSSDGLQRTRQLAHDYGNAALKNVEYLGNHSNELRDIVDMVICRVK